MLLLIHVYTWMVGWERIFLFLFKSSLVIYFAFPELRSFVQILLCSLQCLTTICVISESFLIMFFLSYSGFDPISVETCEIAADVHMHLIQFVGRSHP